MDVLLSTRHAAARMSLSVRSVRRLIARRQLRYVSVCGRSLVPESAISEFFKVNMVQALSPEHERLAPIGGMRSAPDARENAGTADAT